MKKLLALVLAIVMMLGIASVASADSLQDVLDAGVLKVGIDPYFAPMTFKEGEDYVGYDIDLATAVADKLGVEVQFVEVTDWENLAALLENGTVDCIWSGMSYSADRAAVMTLSGSYLESNATILVHDEVAGFIEDLAGKKIAVQEGFAHELLKTLVPEGDIIVCATADDAIAAMLKKASIDAAEKSNRYLGINFDREAAEKDQILADGVLLDSTYADYQFSINESLEDFIKIENLYADQLVIGFAKGDYLLCGSIEEILYELDLDGTVSDIYSKWFE